jgi:hypothetical protein
MKIFATSCATGPTAWTHQLTLLESLFKKASPQPHEWVRSPEQADIIFLTNVMQPEGNAISKHPLPRRFPEKCVVLSDQWEPPFHHAGIYANAPRSLFWKGRFRTGSYELNHPDFKNPYVENYTPDQALPASERRYLFTFAGRNCHPVRDLLFRQTFGPDILVEDTSSFNAFTHTSEGKINAQQRYFELCLQSKFILCPRGCGPNSIRLFEALKLGIAPIILADAWIPAEGPDWSSFAVFVPERAAGEVEARVRSIAQEFEERGRMAREAHDRFFAPERYFNFLVDSANSILKARVIPEKVFLSTAPAVAFVEKVAHRVKRSFGNG